MLFAFAVPPNPVFDVAGLAAGAVGVRYSVFFVSVFAARLIRLAVIVWLGTMLGLVRPDPSRSIESANRAFRLLDAGVRGWLRNVEDEGMPATFAYQRELAQQADRTGWDVTLVAELNLNDIKGPEADCLEAWTTAAALAPLTERLELMTAVRPNFRLPALVAKEAATIDHISNGRFTLNVVSAWWQVESDQYGGSWVQHDERYARTEEFLAVLKGMWTTDEYTLEGRYYTIKNARLAPKPVQKPWPVSMRRGERAKSHRADATRISCTRSAGGRLPSKSRTCGRAVRSIRSCRRCGSASRPIRRAEHRPRGEEGDRAHHRRARERARVRELPGIHQGSQLDTKVSLEDLQRLKSRAAHWPRGHARTGRRARSRSREDRIDLLLLQCSPQREEMERFSSEVFPLVARS